MTDATVPGAAESSRHASGAARPRRAATGRSRLTGVFTGAAEDPRWARPALWVLLAATALLYLVELTKQGYANDFYAASVKSATQSWRAWLWASLDSQLSITVDKPPAAIWVMGLSARIFGFSSFSLLLPQALMGVATVGFTYGAVRRLSAGRSLSTGRGISGHGPGLLAGAIVALTPVAALMFRFDNPDAMLVACVTAAAWMVVRAIQTDRGGRALWWMVGAGWLIGLAFLTKMLQGLLVLPALGLAYLLCANRGWWTRVWHLLAAAGSLVVSAGWLIALCAVWPASSRPYIGGSTDNSLWELAIGYNGLGRVLGGAGNGGGGGAGGGNAMFGGQAGITRMFNSSFGTEISWLLPAAFILLVAGLISCGRRPLSDRPRAGLILWGGSLITTATVFSYMQGTIHPYYTVALAPLIGGTIASGAAELWPSDGDSRATSLTRRIVLALAVAVTGVWGFHLMSTYASSWQPWIRWTALVVSLAGAIVYLVTTIARGASPSIGGDDAVAATDASTGSAATGGAPAAGRAALLNRVAVGALLIGSLAAVAPSASWTLATVASAHSGSIPTSGPASASTGGMGGGPGGAMGQGGGMGQAGSKAGGQTREGGAPGGDGMSRGSGRQQPGADGQQPEGRSQRSGRQAGPGGGMGGGTSTDSKLVKLLNATTTKWSAAVVSDQSAAGYILSTDTAVFSIGGWSGSDNNITLAQFKQYVAEGKIHYFIVGGMGGGGGVDGTASAERAASGNKPGAATGSSSTTGSAPGGATGSRTGTPPNGTTRHGGQQGGPGGGMGRSGAGTAITSWVESTFTKTTVGSTTVYDLTSTTS